MAQQTDPDPGRRRRFLPSADQRPSEQGLEFSVGYPVTEAIRTTITTMPAWARQVACNADGDLREHADVVEVTGLLDLSKWTKTCPDMRVIVRRELPHPGATLDAFEIRNGYRYQAFTTNTIGGQLAFLEARHRAHARAEDRIRTGKDTGLGHLPSRQNINAVWVELALIHPKPSPVVLDHRALHCGVADRAQEVGVVPLAHCENRATCRCKSQADPGGGARFP